MIGSIFLIAGTAIGAGMIALPMALAKLGVFVSMALMLGMWFLIYYTALLGIELNLRAGAGLSLGALGQRFSGPVAQWIGTSGLTFLCVALLAAYMSGSGSLLSQIFHTFHAGLTLDPSLWMVIVAVMLFCLLFQGIKIADYMNRIFFVLMMVGAVMLIACLLPFTSFEDTPSTPSAAYLYLSWAQALPVLFTSFGFHVIFHTMFNYLKMDQRALKKAFFWGSLIPTCLYMAWTGSSLLFLYSNDRLFYESLLLSTPTVGALINSFTTHTHDQIIQMVIWSVSLLAILTSILGVAVGLKEQFEQVFEGKISYSWISFLTLMPSVGVALFIPGAFIKALGFAGMMLVVIAIFLPMWLLYRSDQLGECAHYSILDNRLLRVLVLLCGVAIFAAEILNMV